MKTRTVQRLIKSLQQTDGQSLVMIAILFPVLLGAAGLGVSVGNVYLQQSQLQDAVDAAALAGAKVASVGGTASTQSSLIGQDDAGATGKVAIASDDASNVAANGTKLVSGGFATVFGWRTFTVRARAVAQFGPGAPFSYAVFQGAKSPSLPFNGSDQICGTTATTQSANGPECQSDLPASVHSNGDITLNGDVTITGEVNASGKVTLNGNDTLGSVLSHQPIIATPNWPLPPLPDTSSWQVVNSLAQNQTFTGNYVIQGDNATIQNDTINGSIMVTDGGSISFNGGDTMNGSVYTVGGGSVSFNGNDSVSGNVEATDNTSGSASDITLNGNTSVSGYIITTGGDVTLNGNNSSGSSPGLTIGAFADNGVGGNITANGNVDMTGVLYAPQGNITFNGNDTLVGSAVGHTDILNGNISVYYNSDVVDSVPFQTISLIR